MAKTKPEVHLDEEEVEETAETSASFDLKRTFILAAAAMIGVWIVIKRKNKNGPTTEATIIPITSAKNAGNPEGRIGQNRNWQSVPLKPL